MISGRHVGVTDSMKDYARAKAEKLMRYFERATSCRVTMDVSNLDHTVEMVVEVNRGVTLVGKRKHRTCMRPAILPSRSWRSSCASTRSG